MVPYKKSDKASEVMFYYSLLESIEWQPLNARKNMASSGHLLRLYNRKPGVTCLVRAGVHGGKSRTYDRS